MSEEDRNDGWNLGYRAAWQSLLTRALVELGGVDHEHGVGEMAVARLVAEREAAVAALRHVCEDHGDNDWGPDLYLPDVIEKHLGRYLDDAADSEKEREGS